MKQYCHQARYHYLVRPRRTSSPVAAPLIVLLLEELVLLYFLCQCGGDYEGTGCVVAHTFFPAYINLFLGGNAPAFDYKKRMTRCQYLSLHRDHRDPSITTTRLGSATTTSSSRSSGTGADHSATTTSSSSSPTTTALESLDLGPPEPLQSLQIGQQLGAFRTKFFYNHHDNQYIQRPSNFTIERVSYTPDAFLFRNFLTPYECSLIQSSAHDIGMSTAETITQNDTTSRKNCTVAWLSPLVSSTTTTTNSTTNTTKTTTPCSLLVSNLISSTANILLSKSVLSNPSAGVEDLQVLQYGIGGEFVLHHDGEPRVLTVIYYLNGVGGTWFPLARTTINCNPEQNESGSSSNDPCTNGGVSYAEDEMALLERQFHNIRRQERITSSEVAGAASNSTSSTPWNKEQALDLKRGYQPGTHGLLVQGISSPNFANNQQEDNSTNSSSSSSSSRSHIAWVRAGDALAFYNYHPSPAVQQDNDASSPSSSTSSSSSVSPVGGRKLDWRALHCGLPMTEQEGEKWIANHWFRLNDLLTTVEETDGGIG